MQRDIKCVRCSLTQSLCPQWHSCLALFSNWPIPKQFLFFQNELFSSQRHPSLSVGESGKKNYQEEEEQEGWAHGKCLLVISWPRSGFLSLIMTWKPTMRQACHHYLDDDTCSLCICLNILRLITESEQIIETDHRTWLMVLRCFFCLGTLKMQQGPLVMGWAAGLLTHWTGVWVGSSQWFSFNDTQAGFEADLSLWGDSHSS